MRKAHNNCVTSKVVFEALGPSQWSRGSDEKAQRYFWFYFTHLRVQAFSMMMAVVACVVTKSVLYLPEDGSCNLLVKTGKSPAKDVFI